MARPDGHRRHRRRQVMKPFLDSPNTGHGRCWIDHRVCKSVGASSQDRHGVGRRKPRPECRNRQGRADLYPDVMVPLAVQFSPHENPPGSFFFIIHFHKPIPSAFIYCATVDV